MSAESWIGEFYPKSADDVLADPIAATLHSLVKWRGLTPEALMKHGLEVTTDGRRVYEPESFETVIPISDQSCALCYHYFSPDRDAAACDECPLAKERGGVACTKPLKTEDYGPWDEWRRFQNPGPMILALEATLEGLGGTEEPPVWP